MPLLTARAIPRRPVGAARRAPALLVCAVLLLLFRAAEPANAEQAPDAGRPSPGPAHAQAPVAPAEVQGERSWPVGPPGSGSPPPVIRGWEPPPTPYAAGHRGVDLAAAPGTPVRAATAGTVAFAGTVAGRRVLSVDVEGSGSPPLRITYEPVRADVAEGDRVAAGRRIGVIDTGPFHCVQACLHWGLRREDVYLDPLSLLSGHLGRRPPSRLLPVFGVAEPPAPENAAMSTGSPPPRELLLVCLLTAGGCWAQRRLRRQGPGHPLEVLRRRRESVRRRSEVALSPAHRGEPWPRRPP